MRNGESSVNLNLTLITENPALQHHDSTSGEPITSHIQMNSVSESTPLHSSHCICMRSHMHALFSSMYIAAVCACVCLCVCACVCVCVCVCVLMCVCVCVLMCVCVCVCVWGGGGGGCTCVCGGGVYMCVGGIHVWGGWLGRCQVGLCVGDIRPPSQPATQERQGVNYNNSI